MIKKILSTSDDLENDLQEFDKNEACIEYIKHFRREPPSYLQFEIVDTDKVQYMETPAMFWIMVAKCDVPEWMRHGPNIRTLYGNTLAMLWIEHVATDPPEWMRHSPLIKNNLDKTCFLLWLYYSPEVAPKWMVYTPEESSMQGGSQESNSLESNSQESNSQESNSPESSSQENSSQEDGWQEDDLQEMIQRTIIEYSLLKYSSDPIQQFLIINRHYLINGIKAKFIYKIFKKLCEQHRYDLISEEKFHTAMRRTVFLKYDIFDNLVYHTNC
jgi:hypothetical protein